MKTVAILAAGFLLSTSAYAADGLVRLADDQQHEHHGENGSAAHSNAMQGGGMQNGGMHHDNMMQGGGMQNGGMHHDNMMQGGGTQGGGTHHDNMMQGGGTQGGGTHMMNSEHMMEHRQTNFTMSTHVTYRHDSRGFGMRPDNWNDRPRNFDRARYQMAFTAPHAFHWGAYRRPYGWYYRRWNYGEFLPAAFWVRDYWIDSWWMFDLPVPPYGYEWVRYGDDALLVSVDTGQVLQVEYGVFD